MLIFSEEQLYVDWMLSLCDMVYTSTKKKEKDNCIKQHRNIQRFDNTKDIHELHFPNTY